MAYQRLQNQELMADEDLRLLLMGKTGSGKSATGNLLFNDRVFESEKSSSSVTRVCKSHTGSVHDRSVTVIDTPDFRFSTHTDFDSGSELKRALELCSAGAHAILLFLSLSTFTEQEMEFISWFEHKFGAEALRFTLVLFTHADQRHMRSLGEMIRANPQLSAFIERCGQRYHELNIKAPANRRQVTELMEKIHRLVSENRTHRYTLEMMEETERRREEEKRAEEERRERERQMMLDRVRRETEIRVRREIEQEIVEKLEKERREEKKKEREHQMMLEGVRIETEMPVIRQYEWEEVEYPEEEWADCEQMKLEGAGKETEDISRAECNAEQSNLSETSWNNKWVYMAVGAAGGAVGGAVVGGAVVGGAVGAFFGAVFGAGGGIIADRAKAGTCSVTDSVSSLNKIEEAQSYKL